MTLKLVSAAVILLGGLVLPQQQPPRDARPAPVVGSGTISGTVVSGESTPQPVRGAHVLLNGPTFGYRAVITDESGVFRFSGLPAERFTLSVTKPAFLGANYGAKRPGGQGVPLALTDGESLTDLKVTIYKGGVITGRIVDERGRALPDIEVSASRMAWSAGERQPVGFTTAVTDDKGTYRIFGLSPGEFLVRATTGAGGNIRRLVPAEVDAALKPQPQPQTSAARESESFGWSPFYYPGTPRRESAILLTVSAGEELSGIDFATRLISTARISGVVNGRAGDGGSNINVMLYGGSLGGNGRSATLTNTSDQAKQFQFSGLTPGHYVLSARTTVPAGTSAATAWASTELDVDGRNLDGVQLVLQPGLTISGRVVFENPTGPAPFEDWSVRASPAMNSPASRPDGPGLVASDGTFRIEGLSQGQYLLFASGRTPAVVANRTWDIKSAMIDGVDAVDVPIDIRAGRSISNVVVTMTAERSELSGKLKSSSGELVSDYFVIAFPVNHTFWTGYSRHIRAVRPGTDGIFRITGLPGGDYYLAAVTDVEQGEWLNPSFLEKLVQGAAKVSLASGEKKVQDLQIGK